jgi:hypothetical protein
MKIAYLILAHNTPRQLLRLVKALSSRSCGFFIHVDRKSNAGEFSGIKGDNIHFIQKRVPVFRNDFSHIEASLKLLQTAFAEPCSFDRFVLLSGSDYPLRSVASIERFFENNPDKEFMTLGPMHSEATGKPISWLTAYKLRPGDPAMDKIIRKALMRFGVLPRERDYKTYLRDLVPYGGSEWWAISREACDYILTFMKRNTRVVDFFKNTNIPQETLFQTILGNSHFKSKNVRSLTYTDWSARGPSPAYITEKHLAFFQTTSSYPPDDLFGGGEMLFARKFSDESGDLVARLDDQIREKESRLANLKS